MPAPVTLDVLQHANRETCFGPDSSVVIRSPAKTKERQPLCVALVLHLVLALLLVLPYRIVMSFSQMVERSKLQKEVGGRGGSLQNFCLSLASQ